MYNFTHKYFVYLNLCSLLNEMIFKADALLNKSPLTLCILETPKRVLLQSVKTLFVMVKKIFRPKKYNLLKNYETPRNLQWTIRSLMYQTCTKIH